MAQKLDLPDRTAAVLKEAYQKKERANKRWNELVGIACDLGDLPNGPVRADFDEGILYVPEPTDESDADSE